MLTKSKELLNYYFGYDSFRKGQEEIITRILNKCDTVGIMPTGGGKSLCYQIPAMILPGITIVISPLISLMKDQVDALTKVGIPATYINSSLSNQENQDRLNRIIEGEFKIIYLAPERLETVFFQQLLTQVQISLFAIDEAHCISQWGHDFRPSYLAISKMIGEIHPKPVVLALTATATPQVIKDICSLLRISVDETIVTGFSRENLFYQVVKGENRDSFLEDYIKKNETSAGIIYAATRKEVERLYNQLRKKGIRAGKYHAGMNDRERSQFQEAFLYDDISVIVATSAFGMGINKSNVRYVLHYNIPKNIESYYQEAGRAGRDGEKSECILLFSPQDIHIQKFLIDQSNMDYERKQLEFDKLQQMVGYCHTQSCLQQYILTYFGEESSKCHHCGNCVDEREKVDVTTEAQMVFSCIKRVNERFGKTFIAKILTGSADAKIKNFGFDKLSTYGIMRNYTQKYVSDLIDFLAAEQYLTPTNGAYPVLTLTNRAIHVLRGEVKVYKKETIQVKQISVDNQLFERLRAVRKNIAHKENVPPYIIFSDQSLREMSVKVPLTTHDFLKIKGVGERKLEQYSEVFIAEIKAYLALTEERNVDIETVELPKKVGKKSSTEKSHHETYKLFKNGNTISDIAKQRQLSEVTIEEHLLKCADEGMEINWDQFLHQDAEVMIEEAISQVGTKKLKPIKELLPDAVSYFMIKVYLRKRRK